MSFSDKMDKLKRVLSGQDDDDQQNIVTQVRMVLVHAHFTSPGNPKSVLGSVAIHVVESLKLVEFD